MPARPAEEFVDWVFDLEMVHWCPMGAIILAGKKMKDLDLSTPADQEKFARVLIENEIMCPRCFRAPVCELERVEFSNVVGRIRCTVCGFRFRWFAGETSFRVFDGMDSMVEADIYIGEQPWTFEDKARKLTREQREEIGNLRCAICRERLLHPIKYQGASVRVVCRNAGCRQQWGFKADELVKPLEQEAKVAA